jgi:hypothetical protein
VKRILIATGVILTIEMATAQNKFQLERELSGNAISQIDVAKGTVSADPDGEHDVFVSEDGKVTVRVPRSDLVRPSVSYSFLDGVYSYTITNSAGAARPIEIIRLVGSKEATEVESDPRFHFTGVSWIAGDSGGLLPGQSMTVQIKAGGSTSGRLVMDFMNMRELFEIPQDAPYGLRVLMRNYAKDHEAVPVPVIGPR